MSGSAKACHLCEQPGGELVWQGERLRVVRAVDTPAHPAFYRVIWNAHAAEFSDLSDAERLECMAAVVAVERVLRERLQPAKINLASLGNVVPHLHWHVIARFEDDAHFPAPVWAAASRPGAALELQRLREVLPELDRCVARALSPL